jgi:hypothetical protein
MVDAPEVAREPKLKASDILTQINTKQGVKDYVGADAAVIWFYEDFPPPRGGIRTKLLNADPVIFKASVWVDGKLIATGHANPEGNSNTLKKVESAAVRRALANAGYSTKKAIIRLAHVMVKEGISDKLGSGKKSQERRVGSGLEPKPEESTEPRPTWAAPENLAALKDILTKNGIQWSDVPRLAEAIKDPSDWRQWEAFATSGKTAAQGLISLRDAQLENRKPATPKTTPAAESKPEPSDEQALFGTTFTVVGFETRMGTVRGKEQPVYWLSTEDGNRILAYGRTGLFDKVGYSKDDMKNWDKPGFKKSFDENQRFTVEAVEAVDPATKEKFWRFSKIGDVPF